MSVGLMPVGNDANFTDSNGNPLSGGLLYFYVAGSSTPQDTFTTSAGSVANANPVVLGSGGYPSSGGSVVQIWGTDGVSYKAVLKTSAGVTVWTRDNLEVINDTSVTVDQWVTGPAPTYIGATSFSLVGDQTSTFHVGRRLKTTNSGGTIYSRISASAYGALTTVTVVNDSGTLDAGLSAVSYGLLSATNPSTPLLTDAFPIVSGSADKTKLLRFEIDGFTTATTRVVTVPDADGTMLTSGTTGIAYLNVEDQALTGGVVVTSKSLGTITSGTVTPDPGDRPQQHYTNGGAHTLGVSANAGSILLDITNNASAGAITTSGFTKVTGDPFTTTNGHKFRCSLSVGNAGSLLNVVALQ